MRFSSAVIGSVCTLLLAPASQAQSPAPGSPAASAPPVDIQSLPVVAASASPVVGERVLDEDGVLASGFFAENRVCTLRGCRRFIFDTRSGALILNDRVWSEAYAPTGRGREAIRVKAFTAAELPKPAPDDTALESAPSIKSVSRPQEKKTP